MKNTLSAQIYRIITSNGDSNNSGVTLSVSTGFGVTFTPSDRADDEELIINKDSMFGWTGQCNFNWSDESISQLEDYIRTEIGEWTRDSDVITPEILAKWL